MKIAEVKIGTEYGALDSPAGHNYNNDPRQVKALEIITVQGRVYGHSYMSSGSQRTRSVRRVKIEVLDGGKRVETSWSRDKIKAAGKGDTITVKAQQLVGPWADLRDDIKQRKTKEEARITLEESLTARLKAAGFKIGWGDVEVRVRDIDRIRIEFHDKNVEKLLKKLGV